MCQMSFLKYNLMCLTFFVVVALFQWHGTAPMMSSSVITLCVSRCPGSVMGRMTVEITLMRTLRNAVRTLTHTQLNCNKNYQHP